MSYIGSFLKERSRQRPDALALHCDDRVWSNRDFTDWVCQLKVELRKRSVAGDRIALDCHRADALLAGFFAVAGIRRTAAVLDPRSNLDAKTANTLAAASALLLDDDFICREASHGERGPLAVFSSSRDRSADRPSLEDSFYIGFTSGTTGVAKGYMRSHGSWLHSFQIIEELLGFNETDRVLIPGPLAHSLHLFGAVHALHAGASVYAQSAFHPRRSLEMLRQGRCTFAYATPTQLLTLKKLAGQERYPCVRTILVGGAEWTEDMAATVKPMFPNAHILTFYGASETSFISMRRPGEVLPTGSVGKPVPGVIVDVRAADGTHLAAGEVGRLWVAGPQNFQDYVGAAKDQLLREGEFICVGDLGYFDASGYLYVTGRENRMIITSGVNVYPAEIEQVVLRIPEVLDCAVGAKVDAKRGWVPVLVAHLCDHAEDDISDFILKSCRKELGPVKAPRQLLIHKEPLPLTPSGKMDYKAIDRFIDEQT
ncbi:AMP-binding protein [Pseudovibrio exalbescens]|uniref:class I adenylate-forming enzyme family protein n=1 Tax=Pseudovibrio exalbescens TaxID=197461 RepID=UPI0023656066|nr:AMP-binding protein [Pseudovibrio exalbescens]MDD7911704.1 AMP-binding protein [Pseudovibrio exalbescens]